MNSFTSLTTGIGQLPCDLQMKIQDIAMEKVLDEASQRRHTSKMSSSLLALKRARRSEMFWLEDVFANASGDTWNTPAGYVDFSASESNPTLFEMWKSQDRIFPSHQTLGEFISDLLSDN